MNEPTTARTVSELLQLAARSTPDRPFIRFGEEVRTYVDIDTAARRYGAGILEAGVAPGDLVGIMMKNRLEFIEVYAALVYRGAAVVLINPEFRGYMLEYVLNDAACAVVIADDASAGELARSAPRLESLTTVLSVDGPGQAAAPSVVLRHLARHGAAMEPEGLVGPRDLHCVVYSSGTTGPSKGIMISNAHAIAKAWEVIRICAFTPDDILYSPLPLFYSMGLLRGVLSVALQGSSIVLREKFSVTEYWDDVRRSGATVAHSVFSLPVMLASRPPHPDDRSHTLRCMFNARHDPGFQARFGVRLLEGYGLTEAGNAIYSRPDRPPVEGSCGQVSEEWEVRLVDPSGNEVAIGESGEILLRPLLPDRIMIGYLNKPEQTVAATRDLWFHTGDLAARDDAGNYFFKGRLKEMIRRRGQNISAWEVEQIVMAFGGIAEVAAVPMPADIGDDDLRIVVVAEEGGSVDLERLAEYCVRSMPPFMVPRFFEVRDEVPKTPSGRVEKYKLIESPPSAIAIDLGDRTRTSPR